MDLFMDASMMFQTVVGMELIGNAFFRPETVQREDVLDILSQESPKVRNLQVDRGKQSI
jgi:hypothetical protein